MIPVVPQPEPEGFNDNVRKPGQAFLATCPHPVNNDWREHRYWRYAKKELYNAYSGVCAYTCEWFSLQDDPEKEVSVDHFHPKAIKPQLAYEWRNYRLSTKMANGNKGSNIILDPFEIKFGWFTLSLPDCQVTANIELDPLLQEQIKSTIHILRLNSNDDYVEGRREKICEYANGDYPLAFLRRRYPFIAFELERQNKNIDDLKQIFKKYFEEKRRVNANASFS